jgi:hypothetical protein
MRLKTFLLLLISTLIIAGCGGKSKTTVSHDKATISFDTLVHDFGNEVIHEKKQEYKFVFHNTGATPLVIHDAKAGCSCTVASFDKEPVMPGESGEIKVTYLANNGLGRFSHFISVFSNGAGKDGYTNLHIFGQVIEDK